VSLSLGQSLLESAWLSQQVVSLSSLTIRNLKVCTTLQLCVQCNQTGFPELAAFTLNPNEEITTVIPLSATVDNALKAFFVVGTFIYDPEEIEPEVGRVLLVSVSTVIHSRSRRPAFQLSVAAETEVKGCVYALTPISDGPKGRPRFVAAVNSSIMLFQLTIDEEVFPAALDLKRLTDWNHNYLVTSLGSAGEHVFAGDQISSVSLLKAGEEKLQTVARDYGPQWPISVEAIDEKNVIGANVNPPSKSFACISDS
jgi:DNA damage-binding protein 1